MEDNLNFLKMEDDLNFFKMEDNLSFFLIGRPKNYKTDNTTRSIEN